MNQKKNLTRLAKGLACLGLALGTACWSPTAKADSPTTAPSLDDLLNLPQPGGKPATGAAAPKEATGVKPEAEVARRMSGQQAAEAFAKAIQDMYDVSERLAKQQDPGDDTQRMQGDILNKLEQVIAAAQQQQQKGKSSDDQDQQESREADSGSQENSSQGDGDQGEPGEPGNGSKGGKSKPGKSAKGGATPGTATASASGGTSPDSAILKDSRESWGKLPPRLRDQLLEGLSENVSPVYKDMTESYYRRLAEESGK